MIFRMLVVLLGALLRPRTGFLDECTIALRVWPNDVDSNLHMNNSRYLLAMDVGRWDLAVRTGLWRELVRRRWFPVLGSASLRFRRPLDPFQRYRLVTRLVAWDEKWIFVEQRFERGAHLHAVGRVKALFRGRQGHVSTAALFAAAGYPDAPSSRMPEAIRLWEQAEAAERAARPERRDGDERSQNDRVSCAPTMSVFEG